MADHRTLLSAIFIIVSSLLYNSPGIRAQTDSQNWEDDILDLKTEVLKMRKDLQRERRDRQSMIDSLNHTVFKCTADCKGTSVKHTSFQDLKESVEQTSAKSDCKNQYCLQVVRRSFQAEKAGRRELGNKLEDTEHKCSSLVDRVDTIENKILMTPKQDYDLVLSKINDVEIKFTSKVDLIEKKFAELASRIQNLTRIAETLNESRNAHSLGHVGGRIDAHSLGPVGGHIGKDSDSFPSQPDLPCHVKNHCNNPQFSDDPCAVIVSRGEWGARETLSVSLMREPAKIVFIHHTVTSRCLSTSICSKEVKKIQNYHMDKSGFDDIGYSFVVGDDGRAYEARGWDRVGAHTRGWNDVSISIAVMGNYNNYHPGQNALQAINSLINCGVRKGKIKQDYKLYGQRDAVPTESPGNTLYNLMKTWPHYQTKPPVKE